MTSRPIWPAGYIAMVGGSKCVWGCWQMTRWTLCKPLPREDGFVRLGLFCFPCTFWGSLSAYFLGSAGVEEQQTFCDFLLVVEVIGLFKEWCGEGITTWRIPWNTLGVLICWHPASYSRFGVLRAAHDLWVMVLTALGCLCAFVGIMRGQGMAWLKLGLRSNSPW